MVLIKNKCLTLNFIKMKNLQNYGVQEMNARELKEVGGGFWWIIAIVILGIIFATDGNSNTSTTINGHRVGN